MEVLFVSQTDSPADFLPESNADVNIRRMGGVGALGGVFLGTTASRSFGLFAHTLAPGSWNGPLGG